MPEISDVALSERVHRAHEAHRAAGDRCIFVSVHGNAAAVEAANGLEIFTTVGETESDKVATVFMNKFSRVLPEVIKRPDNSDGDPDKERNFYVIRKTVMPAILIELGFMTNERECKDLMMTDTGRDRYAEAIVSAMGHIDRYGWEV